MSIIKKFGNWLHEFVVDLYPYMICLFGACLIGLSSKATGSLFWGALVLAFCSFIFALDAARTRAKAKATNDVALQILGFLMRGEDQTINVYHHNKRD